MATKLVGPLDEDKEAPWVYTVPSSEDPGAAAINVFGVGQPFLAFEEIDNTIESNIRWNHVGAPIVSNSATQNNASIEAMLANPPLDRIWAGTR